MKFLKQTLATLAIAAVPLTAMSAPAKVMAPGGPGGGYDAAARVPLQVMQQTGIFTDGFQVTNKGGAGGTIGLAEFVRTGKGDDNAIMSMGAILVGAIITNKSPVTLDQVVPLVRLSLDTGAIVVAADSPIKTAADALQAFKFNPGGTTIAGGSIGGTDHVTAALLAKAVDVAPTRINYLPYASGAEVVTALASGQAKIGISGLSEVKSYVSQGRLRIIAVSSEQRLPGIDAPTLKESGYDVVIGNWRGIVGAPGMSKAGRDMWLQRYAKLHASPEWKKALADHGWDDAYLAGDDFAAFLTKEKARQAEVLKDVGLVK
ncbi:C4-dicarboxylate ABC transporter substrate-binding protein [Pigmentiphaga sp. NML080357]|uniref:Bug family tripartite tricarboxylate transporter substrate binding protein n=1 Tax=Pigmentiphaga sp. NML080357 TaxID=2008675 RepID=UPI000B412888|nr:tripartite tricarboxylate transporter substrate-binding protein [Pigmentiphaga sp. NML080357]OVZ58010.1 C4-dicarboxylate ABC transporter substrate-binding protein [Pigmentiphaga sp. NML080357]